MHFIMFITKNGIYLISLLFITITPLKSINNWGQRKSKSNQNTISLLKINNIDYITEHICHHVNYKLKRLQFVSNSKH